jgi:hypothetical protein
MGNGTRFDADESRLIHTAIAHIRSLAAIMLIGAITCKSSLPARAAAARHHEA